MMKNETMLEFYEMEILTDGALDIILGIIATFTSLALFLEPLPTVWRIFQKKDTGGLLPYPYVFAELSSVYWLMYAVPRTGTTISFRDFCLSCSSCFGCVTGGIYHLIFWNFCKKDNYRFFFCALGSLIVTVSWMFPQWYALMDQGRNGIFGPIVILFGVMMYASPIFTVFEAMHTKRQDYLPFGLLRASCYNGFAWTLYACLTKDFDLCITTANGVGTVLSLALLVLACDIRSFLTINAKQTNDCSARKEEEEDSKFMQNASAPLLNASCPSLKLKGQVVEEEEVATNSTVKEQPCKLEENGLNIATRHTMPFFPTSNSLVPNLSAIGGELEAKFNEFGLPAVMSYAVVSQLGGFLALLHIEKSMRNMNKNIDGHCTGNSQLQQENDDLYASKLRELTDKFQVKLKEILEAVDKEGGRAEDKEVKLKQLLESILKNGDEV